MGNSWLSCQQEVVLGYFRELVLICIMWELFCVFLNISVMLYSGPVVDVPGRSGTGDVSTEVEKDKPASKRPVVVTKRLAPLAGDGMRPSHSGVPVLERSCELLEQAFDNGMAVSECVSFEYCSHWFHVYMIAYLRPTQCWSCQYCHSRHWTPACYTLQGCVWGKKSTDSESPNGKNWYHFYRNPGIVPY